MFVGSIKILGTEVFRDGRQPEAYDFLTPDEYCPTVCHATSVCQQTTGDSLILSLNGRSMTCAQTVSVR